MSETKPNRYIPKWDTIQKAAKTLPLPESFRDDEYHAPVGERLISFRKIKFKTKLGTRCKWVYDGKVMMD